MIASTGYEIPATIRLSRAEHFDTREACPECPRRRGDDCLDPACFFEREAVAAEFAATCKVNEVLRILEEDGPRREGTLRRALEEDDAAPREGGG